ncbi:MAG: hypothetical protein ABSC22_19380 [Roseiarcus sp.]
MTSFACRAASLPLCATVACLVAGSAFAGDPLTSQRPIAAPNGAHCGAIGEGYFAVAGSNACVKISGYVAAGGDFGGVLRAASHDSGPFGAAPASALGTRTGVSADARFDTPVGPGRLYLQMGRDSPQP